MFQGDWSEVGTKDQLEQDFEDFKCDLGWHETETDTVFVETITTILTPQGYEDKYRATVWNRPGVRQEIANLLGNNSDINPSKFIEIDRHSSSIIRHALALRYRKISAQKSLLLLSKQRDLTEEERWQLPINLFELTQTELQEQIEPWISLEIQVRELLEEFKV